MATRTTPQPAQDPRKTRDERDRRDDAKKPRDTRDAAHEGDILGISGATAPIPQATTKKGGNPKGIEIDSSDTPGADDLEQSAGATSIDMGAGGKGQKVDH